MGQTMLETELAKYGGTLKKFQKNDELKDAARDQGFRKVEELFLAIAQGRVTALRVCKKLLPEEAFEKASENPGAITQLFQKIRRRTESPVLINGVEDVMVTYAKCCRPVPGEAVMGFVTRGRGITVHLSNCAQMLALDSDRRVPVQWHGAHKGRHSGEVRIVCTDTMGMLAEIGAVCKTTGINVTRMEAGQIEDNKAEIILEVSIVDVRELHHLMRLCERIKGVIAVDRVRGQVQS